jgi:hypothetical protein
VNNGPGGDVVEARGGDAGLAAVIHEHPGAAVRFLPDATSDLARAIGLGRAGEGVRQPTTLDVLRVDEHRVAVNMVVLGTPPDRRHVGPRPRRCRVEVDGRVVWDGRATGVVIANGEYLRGLDVVPRGHPGDGRLEVHVHALRASQRKKMQARLATGAHLPHPGIHTGSGTRVTVRWNHPAPREVDGVRCGRARETVVAIAPGALTIVP